MKSSLYNEILKDLVRRTFPSNIKLYNIEGRTIFEVRNSSGLTDKRIGYLTTKIGDEHFKYAFELSGIKLEESPNVKELFEYFEGKLKESLEAFLKFLDNPEELEKAREIKRKEDAESDDWFKKLQAHNG